MQLASYNIIYRICASGDNEGVKRQLSMLNLRKTNKPLDNIYHTFKWVGKTALKDISLEQDLLSYLFILALKQNNIHLCTYLIETNELYISLPNTIYIWHQTISSGNISVLEALIKANKIKNIAKLIVESLEKYSELDKLDVLKYLLDNSIKNLSQKIHNEFKKNHNTTHTFYLFVNACIKGNPDCVDFLLNHTDYNKMINEHTLRVAVRVAVKYNNANIIDKLIKKLNLYDNISYFNLLTLAIEKNSHNVIEYLIFDLGIEKPKNMNHFLDEIFNTKQIEFKEKYLDNLNKLFDIREQHNKLTCSLNFNSDIKKGKKLISKI